MWSKLKDGLDLLNLEKRIEALEKENAELRKAVSQIQKQFFSHQGDFAISEIKNHKGRQNEQKSK